LQNDIVPMAQQEFLQSFSHLVVKKPNKEHGEEMRLTDAKMPQIRDIKFDYYLHNELW